MKEIICVDIETATNFAAFEQTGALKTFQSVHFAQHEWVAVTNDAHGDVRRWGSDNAYALWTYLAQHTVVGWNITDFDLPIIGMTMLIRQGTSPIMPIDVIDPFAMILKETKVMHKLEEVSQLNLGVGKCGNSAEIPAMLRAGQRETVFEHCQRDVELELRLFEMATTSGIRLPSKPPSKNMPSGCDEIHWTLQLPT
jgi:hypothetical protein